MREGRQRRSLRDVARLVGVASALSLAGCHSCGPSHEDGAAVASIVIDPPVPAPGGRLADIVLASPDATWGRVQRAAGGTVGVLPSTLGGLACAGAGVDPTLGQEVDGASPAYAVVAGNAAAPSWALAMRLRDPRALARLVGSDTARFHARDVGGLTLLDPGAPPRPGHAVAAIARSGYLVLAGDEASLAALGPYVTRTLPVAKLPIEAVAIDVPGPALSGPFRDAMLAAWTGRRSALIDSDRAMRAAHDGHAPDFGDPAAILGSLDALVKARLAVLGDVTKLHVGIDTDDAAVRASFTATPASSTGPVHDATASMTVGDVSPVLALPKDTAIAMLARSGAADRAEVATQAGDALAEVLGNRWKPADDKRMRAALDDWAHARGDWMTLGLVWGASSKGALVDTPTSDPDLANRAVREAVDAVDRTPALRAPIAHWLDVADIAQGSFTLANGAHATLAAVMAKSPSGPPHPAFTLGWSAGEKDVRVALATAQDVPALLVPPDRGATLADDPAMHALLAPVGPVAGALVLQASRAPACAGVPGGVVFAWGRRPAPASTDADADAQPPAPSMKDDGGAAGAMWGTVQISSASLKCLAPAMF